MPIRFQADADLNEIIVTAVVRRVPEIDFKTATAAGLAGLRDADVLALAAQDGRVLVTHDQRTMPTHFDDFVRRTESPGLILVPQSVPIHVAVDDIILIWMAAHADEWINRIVYLPI
jgi:predicted nuclease of predicted toxin-antitoxin system